MAATTTTTTTTTTVFIKFQCGGMGTWRPLTDRTQGGDGLGGWQPPQETREKASAFINRLSVPKITWTAVILRSRDGHDGMRRSRTGTGHNCWACPGAARALETALEPASEPHGALGMAARRNVSKEHPRSAEL